MVLDDALPVELGRKVLVERAAERDVHDMKAAADAENRQVVAVAPARDLPVERVAVSAPVAALRQRRFPVAERRDIMSARHQEPVQVKRQLLEIGLVDMERKNDRNRAGGLQAVEIARQHPDTDPAVVKERRDADQRLEKTVPRDSRKLRILLVTHTHTPFTQASTFISVSIAHDFYSENDPRISVYSDIHIPHKWIQNLWIRCFCPSCRDGRLVLFKTGRDI